LSHCGRKANTGVQSAVALSVIAALDRLEKRMAEAPRSSKLGVNRDQPLFLDIFRQKLFFTAAVAESPGEYRRVDILHDAGSMASSYQLVRFYSTGTYELYFNLYSIVADYRYLCINSPKYFL
jgi:hypothetical protein